MASKKEQPEEESLTFRRAARQPGSAQVAVEMAGANVPKELRGMRVEESGIPETVKFEEPGDFCIGQYVSTRPPVPGTRIKSKLYLFRDEKGMFGVWGSTQLDQVLAMMNPKVGERIGVVYKGTAPTARNQSPVKLFAVFHEPPADAQQ